MQENKKSDAPGSAGGRTRNSKLSHNGLLSGTWGKWHTRGYLPHFDQAKRIQMVTYRLADSMPRHVLERLKKEMDSTGEGETEYRRRVEKFLDAGHGECPLGQEEIAAVIRESWLYHEGQRYFLHAWVIMPNHVHVLVETIESHSFSDIVKGWKSVTTRRINRMLRKCGPLWQAEYWDRFIRDKGHYEDAVEYIRQNPVKAGLAAHREQWKFSWWVGREEKK